MIPWGENIRIIFLLTFLCAWWPDHVPAWGALVLALVAGEGHLLIWPQPQSPITVCAVHCRVRGQHRELHCLPAGTASPGPGWSVWLYNVMLTCDLRCTRGQPWFPPCINSRQSGPDWTGSCSTDTAGTPAGPLQTFPLLDQNSVRLFDGYCEHIVLFLIIISR